MKLFGKTKSADADEEPLVADEGIEPADIEGGQVVDTDAAADAPDDFSTPEDAEDAAAAEMRAEGEDGEELDVPPPPPPQGGGKKKMLLLGGGLVVALALGLGLGLGLTKDSENDASKATDANEGSDQDNIGANDDKGESPGVPTYAPTTSWDDDFGVTTTEAPPAETTDDEPTADDEPAADDTPAPSPAPTEFPFKCFEDRDELKRAIDRCFEGDDQSTAAMMVAYNPARCEGEVKPTYGWPMNEWCVGDVTDFQLLFVGKRDFNEDIGDWDTSQVTDMYETFSYAESFDQDLSKWDTSKVTKMYGMFNGAAEFNQDITGWDMGSLEDMQWMFYGATKFNQEIGAWDTSNVENMYEIFAFAESFNGDIGSWDTSKVLYMKWLFWDAESFNQDISGWDLTNVEDMEGMFQGATAFNQDLCAWKDTFPYGVDATQDIFTDSGCLNQGRPRRSNEFGGPFCASDCAPAE